MEVRNRLKGLDLIDRVSVWTEVHDIVQEAGIKTIPKKKKCKKAKWLSEEALELRKEEKGEGPCMSLETHRGRASEKEGP